MVGLFSGSGVLNSLIGLVAKERENSQCEFSVCDVDLFYQIEFLWCEIIFAWLDLFGSTLGNKRRFSDR